MRGRGYERPAFMAMQIMYDGFVQIRARHAILRFGQLELGRPIAPHVLQPQHLYKSLARIGHHDLQTGSSTTQRTRRRPRKGFVGNTILLTQPRPQEIMQTLPPADDEVSNYCLLYTSPSPRDRG